MRFFEQGLDFFMFLHLFATFAMCGIIWMVQLVHYPSFKFVESSRYREFQYFHMGRISVVVGPLMLVELITLGLVLFEDFKNIYLISSGLCLVLIWLNTALWNVPLHNKLLVDKNDELIDRLVLSNWPRTILWSVRLILLGCYLL
jgi:sulfite exporter TauE/SafE